ncbi:hypothetical protein D3C75_1320460 [compost metagenome]
MVLCSSHRTHGFSIHKGKNRHFLTGQKLFNNNLCPGFPKHLGHHDIPQGEFRLFPGVGHGYTFSCCQPIRFDDNRQSLAT